MKRFTDRLALKTDTVTWTYADLHERVADAACRLAAWGVQPGDTVGLWGLNSADWVVAFHALVKLGAIALPLNARWTDAELGDGLQRAQARHLLADTERMPRARGLHGRVVSLAQVSSLPAASLAGNPRAAAILASEPNLPLVRMLTSGTSGRPKVVELSRGALAASAKNVATALALTDRDRWWAAMPLWHVGGLGVLLRAPLVGAAVQLASRFDPDEILAPDAGITVASFVPTMLAAVLERLGDDRRERAKHDRPWPASLRAAMLGGAPVPPDLVSRCPVALPTYGLTEAGSTVTLAPLDPSPAARAGSGRPLPGNAIRILDADGRPLPTGAVGRVQVQGPTLMTRYVGDPDATARTLVDGWLETGDAGHLDEAGRLYLHGRREDLIVSGGENVYPAEIEAVLGTHPALAAVAVVGVPHPRWGQTPFAFVVPRGDLADAPRLLDDYLQDRLARFKRPRGYALLPTLPLLSNGKPDRRALREAAERAPLALE